LCRAIEHSDWCATEGTYQLLIRNLDLCITAQMPDMAKANDGMRDIQSGADHGHG
jgi:hypothetical protein